jgi:hypothetical protein
VSPSGDVAFDDRPPLGGDSLHFELRHGQHHVQRQLPVRSPGVEAIGDTHELAASLVDAIDQADRVRQAAPEAVESGNHDTRELTGLDGLDQAFELLSTRACTADVEILRDAHEFVPLARAPHLNSLALKRRRQERIALAPRDPTRSNVAREPQNRPPMSDSLTTAERILCGATAPKGHPAAPLILRKSTSVAREPLPAQGSVRTPAPGPAPLTTCTINSPRPISGTTTERVAQLDDDCTRSSSSFACPLLRVVGPRRRRGRRPRRPPGVTALADDDGASAERVWGGTALAEPHAVGSRGDAYDNAVAESFFATLKKELIRRRTWPTRRELIGEVFA